MLQQINLYPLLPVESRFQLTGKRALSIYSIFILVLIFICGLEFRAKQHALKEYTVLNTEVMTLNAKFASLTQKYPISDSAALLNNIQTLDDQLTSKSNLLDLLNNKKNFSSYLLGLANTDIKSVWFTEMQFNNVGQKIDLKGFALNSDLIKQMLVQLDAQPAFSKLHFEIQTIDETPPPPSFELSAKQEDASW